MRWLVLAQDPVALHEYYDRGVYNDVGVAQGLNKGHVPTQAQRCWRERGNSPRDKKQRWIMTHVIIPHITEL